MSNQLTNKVTIVFGASQGIGLATVHKLVEAKAKVVMAVRNPQDIQSHLVNIQQSGANVHAFKCDVSAYEYVKSCIDFTQSTYGKVDIVINSAGTIDPLSHLIDSDPDLWHQAIHTNFAGAYNVIRASAPLMKAQAGGTIISLSSGAANSILEGWSHYCSTKAAVKKLTEVAHKELIAHNIHVIGLSPGTVATDMMLKIQKSQLNAVSRLDWSTHIPADWAAQALLYLCSEEGKQHAGTDFSIKTKEGRQLAGLDTANASD